MKHRTAFGIFKDGPIIKIAYINLVNNGLEIENLRERVLSNPLYLKESPEIKEENNVPAEETTKPESTEVEEELAIPDLTEIEEGEGVSELEKEEVLTGRTDLKNLLIKFPLEKGRISMNVEDEYLQTFEYKESFAVKKIRKKLKQEIFSKEELKLKNFSLDYIIKHDNSIRAYTHKGSFDLLRALQDINYSLARKKYFYSYIEPNEIALMNLVRANYNFKKDKYTTILYLGEDYKTGIVMKGKEHYRTFPIIVSEARADNLLDVIHSKILLEQDVSNIPITEHIIITGDYVSKEDIDFFQDKFGSDAKVENLEIKKINSYKIIIKNNNFSKKEIAKFAIPISLAIQTLVPKCNEFFQINLLPPKVIEAQKHFKITWHGFIVLGLIFVAALMGTMKNLKIREEISATKHETIIIDKELQKNRALIAKYKEIKEELTKLEKNMQKIDNLTKNRVEWFYIINKLSNSLQNNPLSWLESINGDADKFRIKGYTTKRENILKFSSLFPNCEIGDIRQLTLQEIQLWNFSLIFSYPETKDIDIDITKTIEPIGEDIDLTKTIEPINEENTDIKYKTILDIYFSEEYEKAYRNFKKFNQDHPDYKLSYNSYYLMGECLYQMGRISDAKEIFMNVLKKNNSKTPDALMMLANCYLEENNKKEAIKYLERLVRSFPQNPLSEIAIDKINKNIGR